MRLTIAFDDISLPLPPMRAPDVRQRVIEAVLDLAADAGVDDVVLIAALALHRRMTDPELRHALGDRVFEAFAPHGLLMQHDAEDRSNLVDLGVTDHGEDVEINRRAAESDLLIYVNINLSAMDGGHKSVATGLASYKEHQGTTTNVRTMLNSRSFMDIRHSELHSSNWRMGRFIAESGVKLFQIEDDAQHRHLPQELGFLQKARVGVVAQGPSQLPGNLQRSRRTPGGLSRKIFHSVYAPPPTSPRPGGRRRGRARGHARQLSPAARRGLGQTDVLTMGLPYIGPYNVNSTMNPILVACLGLVLLLQPLSRQAPGA